MHPWVFRVEKAGWGTNTHKHTRLLPYNRRRDESVYWCGSVGVWVGLGLGGVEWWWGGSVGIFDITQKYAPYTAVLELS